MSMDRQQLRTRRVIPFLLLVAVLLLGAACGSDAEENEPGDAAAVAGETQPVEEAETDEPADASGIDACSLISTEELTEIVGRPIILGEKEGPLECAWVADDTEAPIFVLAITVTPNGEDLYEQNRGTGATPLEGIGDDAFEVGGFVNFIKDGVWVNMFGGGEHMPAIAKVMADNL